MVLKNNKNKQTRTRLIDQLKIELRINKCIVREDKMLNESKGVNNARRRPFSGKNILISLIAGIPLSYIVGHFYLYLYSIHGHSTGLGAWFICWILLIVSVPSGMVLAFFITWFLRNGLVRELFEKKVD